MKELPIVYLLSEIHFDYQVQIGIYANRASAMKARMKLVSGLSRQQRQQTDRYSAVEFEITEWRVQDYSK
jgi:hypothetical protein